MPAAIDRDKVKALTEQRERKFREQTKQSKLRWEEALRVLPLGVGSSFQAQPPYPTFIERGKGARVWDVDGRQLVDFHAGFGVMVMGHANPIITQAIVDAANTGTHFAAPGTTMVRVAEELVRRFRLPKVRFTNSGTESNLDALRLARAFTGKQGIVKIEGSYHGHFDSVMVSVHPDPAMLGPREKPAAVPFTEGMVLSVLQTTSVVPFNDPDALNRHLEERKDVAALIIEPIMLNIGVVLPKPGYLEAVREITRRHGVLLIFDEVKTGNTIAAGGVIERFGVLPDLVSLAKATGGGTPLGAVMGTEEVMALISEGRVKQLGTFNGNRLSVAAAEACLTRVLTPAAYARLDAAAARMQAGCGAVIDRYGLPAYPVGISAKGCVMFSPQPVEDYRGWAAHVDADLAYLGWLYHMTSGIYMTAGKDEQWTLSIAHEDEDIDSFVAVFEEFAADVTAN